MSDSHGRHARFALPAADVFVHAGDFSNYGSGVEEFALWYWQLPYRHKFIVLGNHETKDAVQVRPLDVWRKLFGPTLLDSQTTLVEVDGERLVLHGAPYGAEGASVPDETALLITHEPPVGILDRNVGSDAVREVVSRARPRLHLFGHIHAFGGHSAMRDGTLHVNAATRAVAIDTEPAFAIRRVISASASFRHSSPSK